MACNWVSELPVPTRTLLPGAVALCFAMGCGSGDPVGDHRVSSMQVELAELKDRVAAVEGQAADTVAALSALADVVAALPSGGEDGGGDDGGGDDTCPAAMVAVGDFFIDEWKASVWDSPVCDGAGVAYGIDSADYPGTFPESGDWTAPLYACSIEGVIPAGNLTWFQASQACALSGKSLCTNAQWQTAVAGTPSDEAACALSSGELVATGAYPSCLSNWGTYDQVGIRWEWVAEWTSGGATWMEPDEEDRGRQTPWPVSYGDGQDYTLNVNGEAMGTDGMAQGLPAATIRGGDYSNGAEGGSFALSRARGPSHIAPFVGFRCCAGR